MKKFVQLWIEFYFTKNILFFPFIVSKSIYILKCINFKLYIHTCIDIYMYMYCIYVYMLGGRNELLMKIGFNSFLTDSRVITCHLFYRSSLCFSVPDETKWPWCGHSTDPQAVESESVWRRSPAFPIAMETPLDDTHGYCFGFGALSLPVEAVWHFSLPDTEELRLTVSFSITHSCGHTVTGSGLAKSVWNEYEFRVIQGCTVW